MDRLSPAHDTLGMRNDLCVRLARTRDEIVTAQKLRYSVFYEELSAKPDPVSVQSRRDADRFDAFCDHLIVVRKMPRNGQGQYNVDGGEMVGTYRLLRQSVAEQNGGFYTQGEFDIAPLLAAKSEVEVSGTWKVLCPQTISDQARRRAPLAGYLELCETTRTGRYAGLCKP